MATDPTKTTWIDDRGYETGVTVCGAEASTHPDDPAGGLEQCSDCGRNTCAQCRTWRKSACICSKCSSPKTKRARRGGKRKSSYTIRKVTRLRRVARSRSRRGYGVMSHQPPSGVRKTLLTGAVLSYLDNVSEDASLAGMFDLVTSQLGDLSPSEDKFVHDLFVRETR